MGPPPQTEGPPRQAGTPGRTEQTPAWSKEGLSFRVEGELPVTRGIQSPCDRTFHILHDHTQVAPGLEGAEHADHKRVLGKREDVTLHKDLLDLVAQNQVLLVDLLDGKALPCVSVPHQVDSPGGAGVAEAGR